MLEEIAKYFAREWSVIASAPATFAMATLVVAFCVWRAMSWGFGREISLLKSQVTDYKEKLSGATPDEARAKIAALESQVSRLASREWPALTEQASETLKRRLRAEELKKIEVFIDDRDALALCTTLISAFNSIGWIAMRNNMPHKCREGINVYSDLPVAEAVSKAIEDATGYKVENREKRLGAPEDVITISIGQKLH
jgi:hypothetical protein